MWNDKNTSEHEQFALLDTNSDGKKISNKTAAKSGFLAVTTE